MQEASRVVKSTALTKGEIHRKWKQSEWKCTEFIERNGGGGKPISDWGFR